MTDDERQAILDAIEKERFRGGGIATPSQLLDLHNESLDRIAAVVKPPTLVEQVVSAISDSRILADNWDEAEAAIRAVADWFENSRPGSARELRNELERES